MAKPDVCPDCSHESGRCDEECCCNCDAAMAEDEAARLRSENETLKADYQSALRNLEDLRQANASLRADVSRMGEERDSARAEVETVRRTSEYWKAEHLAGLERIRELEGANAVIADSHKWGVKKIGMLERALRIAAKRETKPANPEHCNDCRERAAIHAALPGVEAPPTPSEPEDWRDKYFDEETYPEESIPEADRCRHGKHRGHCFGCVNESGDRTTVVLPSDPWGGKCRHRGPGNDLPCFDCSTPAAESKCEPDFLDEIVAERGPDFARKVDEAERRRAQPTPAAEKQGEGL